jgi:small subunit ribosomal protein S20
VAHHESAKKRFRQSEKRHERNVARKSALKTAVKKFRTAVDTEKVDDAQTQFNALTKVIDRSASKRIIHKNRAARMKSRLSAKLRALQPAAPAAPPTEEANQ